MSDVALMERTWEDDLDYNISMMIGGYNSNYEFFERGKHRLSLEKLFLEIYYSQLEYFYQNAKLNTPGIEGYFITMCILEEEACCRSSDFASAAAYLYIDNALEYSKYREKLRKTHDVEERDDIIGDAFDSAISYIYESEYSSYNPYCQAAPPMYSFLCEKGFSFISDDGYEDIYLVINDCQNSLCEETRNCVNRMSECLMDYEDELIDIAHSYSFIRISSEQILIGGE